MGSEVAAKRPVADSPNSAANDLPPLSVLRIAALIASLLIGVALGLVALAQVFVYVPTDVRRLGLLHRAITTTSPPPDIVVFGNSVLMSGVDGHALTNALPGHPVAWNLASTGQNLLEAYLLSQDLPDSVTIASYSLFPQPDHEVEALNAQKYNTLFMYGFRPSPATLETVGAIHGAEVQALLERSAVAQVFASRWAIRQFVDTRARSLLRTDLALDRATYDLYHPQSYLHPIEPTITQGFLARRLDAFAEAKPVLEHGATALAQTIAKEAAAKGRATVFLFPPLHPEIVRSIRPQLAARQAEFRDALAEAPGVRFVDATELLGSTLFIDDLHPTNEGAAILSQHIAAALREAR
jgi:hypothetical protein